MFGCFSSVLIHFLSGVRSLLLLIVIALLVVVIVLVDDNNSGFSDDQFGGPYPFAPTGERAEKKRVDFECYMELGLSLSQAVKLDDDLFERSIRANDESPDRTDAEKYDTQKYNYAINERGEIIVAKWENTSLVHDKEVSANCRDRRCNEKSRRDFDLDKDLGGIMINWFPEAKAAVPKQSPCWLTSPNKDGLLDAISKHFMLAQGYRFTIDDFDWNDWKDKKRVKVAYAGEITVDLVSCTYSLNNNSGTYGPEGGELKSVAKHFANEIHVRPIKYFNFIFENGKLKSMVPTSTDNLLTTTAKIPNCP